MKKLILLVLGVVLLVAISSPQRPHDPITPRQHRILAQMDRKAAARKRADRVKLARDEARFRKQLSRLAASSQPITGPVPAAGSCHYSAGGGPDPRCTPGRYNPSVTQRTIHKTICVRGWTGTVRPPEPVTEVMKFRLLRSYGQPSIAHLYELDHLVPLELGGAPADTRNLWPEPHDVAGGRGSFVKDAQENQLRVEVCDGVLTLRQARLVMRHWPR